MLKIGLSAPGRPGHQLSSHITFHRIIFPASTPLWSIIFNGQLLILHWFTSHCSQKGLLLPPHHDSRHLLPSGHARLLTLHSAQQACLPCLQGLLTHSCLFTFCLGFSFHATCYFPPPLPPPDRHILTRHQALHHRDTECTAT